MVCVTGAAAEKLPPLALPDPAFPTYVKLIADFHLSVCVCVCVCVCGLIVLQCDKSTALHFACTQGALEAVKIMLSSYNKVEDIINIRDGANQTPLHRSVCVPCCFPVVIM